jgi:hypothetical protein
VNWWQWTLVGLAAWLPVAVLVAIVTGKRLRFCREAREAAEAQWIRQHGDEGSDAV